MYISLEIGLFIHQLNYVVRHLLLYLQGSLRLWCASSVKTPKEFQRPLPQAHNPQGHSPMDKYPETNPGSTPY